MSLIIHKCFDDGLISIDHDYKLIISDKIDDIKLLKYLSEFNGRKIKLPIKKEYYPDKSLLKKHMLNVFKG